MRKLLIHYGKQLNDKGLILEAIFKDIESVQSRIYEIEEKLSGGLF